MEKTAAMNKLAHAVREYVQAEAQFNKVAATAQQYAMEKNAQNILQRLGLQAAPVKSNMGRNAALAALLLGGLGAGAYGMGRDNNASLKSLSSVIPGLAEQFGSIAGRFENSSMIPQGMKDMSSGLAAGVGQGYDQLTNLVEMFAQNPALKSLLTVGSEKSRETQRIADLGKKWVAENYPTRTL